MSIPGRRGVETAASQRAPGCFSEIVVRWRLVIGAAWLAAAAVLMPLAERLESILPVAAGIAGGGSETVAEALATRFGSPFTESAIAVVTGVQDPRTAQGERVLVRVVDTLSAIPGVSATFSYLDTRDPFFVADDGTGAIVIVGLDPGTETPSETMRDLRESSAAVGDALRSDAPDIAIRWTGEEVLNHDIRAVSQAGAQRAELHALPFTLAALVVAFGAVVAAMLPVLIGVLAIPLALGAAAVLAGWWPLSALLINVVTMIGLALSIDYALLIVDRFRQARAAGHAPRAAAVEAAIHGGRTVVLSGLSVAVGFAALLAVPLDEQRSVAVGGLLAVLTAILLATTLLPGLLAWLGGRIEFGRLRRREAGFEPAEAWLHWGRFVCRHPVVVLLVAALPVAMLALQSTRLRLELPRIDWMPAAAESTDAMYQLANMGRGNAAFGVRLILVLPPDVDLNDPAGWQALLRLHAHLTDDPLIERITSAASAPRAEMYGRVVLGMLPESIVRSLVSETRREALLEVIPSRDLETHRVSNLTRALRDMDAVAVTGLPGTELLVGGAPAAQVEYEDAIADSFPIVVALVLAGTLAALIIGFRSLLVPLKAVALNLLSVAAGFGALVLVFQDGHGAAFFGLAGATDAIYPALPPLVFCAVFGLSMDYEVFFVARVAELRRAGRDESTALVEGLARTGRLITGAAAVMIVVFAAFALQDFLLMQMLGFALAVTVFIDATLVRMAIGPALLRLAGRWNWWPGDLRRAAERRSRADTGAEG